MPLLVHFRCRASAVRCRKLLFFLPYPASLCTIFFSPVSGFQQSILICLRLDLFPTSFTSSAASSLIGKAGNPGTPYARSYTVFSLPSNCKRFSALPHISRKSWLLPGFQTHIFRTSFPPPLRNSVPFIGRPCFCAPYLLQSNRKGVKLCRSPATFLILSLKFSNLLWYTSRSKILTVRLPKKFWICTTAH